MRARHILAMAAPVVVLLTASPAWGDTGQELFVVRDPRISEASGIAPGRLSPDVVYVQNDSGDSARFFALDRATGRTRAEVVVPDARNHDWEDIATGPDVDGAPSVWLADIGDNGEERSFIEVYRVDEPRVGRGFDQRLTASNVQRWTLRYPDHARNAEGFTIDPARKVMYVVTKSATDARVFRAPLAWSPKVQTLQDVGSLRLADQTFASALDVVTGATYSPQLRLFAVRTYLAAYYWHVPNGDLAAALRTEPTRLDVPVMAQAEGIGFDGRALLLNSEGTGQSVYEVSVPTQAASGTSTPTSSAGQPGVRTREPELLPGQPTPHGASRPFVLVGLLALAGIALAAATRLFR